MIHILMKIYDLDKWHGVMHTNNKDHGATWHMDKMSILFHFIMHLTLNNNMPYAKWCSVNRDAHWWQPWSHTIYKQDSLHLLEFTIHHILNTRMSHVVHISTHRFSTSKTSHCIIFKIRFPTLHVAHTIWKKVCTYEGFQKAFSSPTSVCLIHLK